jgi:hypothetical protein
MTTPRRQRAPEAEVEGRPNIVVRDEDREQLAELIAEMLAAAIERENQAQGT